MLARMARSYFIVVTLHCPSGFPSRLLLDEAERLPVETMSAGFSQLILVFQPEAVSAAKVFAARVIAFAGQILRISICRSELLLERFESHFPNRCPMMTRS